MIDRAHDLPITRQAQVLRISRGSVYYLPRPVSEGDLAIMRRLDRLHLEFPFAGSRMLRGLLVAEGCKIGRRHVKTLMKRMGMEALYRRPRTTKPEPGHKIYPYLLRGMEIVRPTQISEVCGFLPQDSADGDRIVTNELEEILLHDLKNERANQFPDPHTPDFRLHGEFTNDFLIER